jgi:ubiquitin carboxyl-terminal hydrolase 8
MTSYYSYIPYIYGIYDNLLKKIEKMIISRIILNKYKPVRTMAYKVFDHNSMQEDENEKIRKSVTVRGLSGLRNLGNTCYMNAGLQCLFATGMLTSYFIDKKFIDKLKNNTINKLAKEERRKQKVGENADVLIDKSNIIRDIKGTVSYAYYKTVKAWIADNDRIEPDLFKQTIGKYNSLFKGTSQNDSQELLNCVLDNIHEDLKCPVQLNYINVPESVLAFKNEVKQYQKMMKSESLSDDNKAELLKMYRKYLDDHMKECAIISALEYWEKFIQPNHSIIRDLFTGMTYTETKCNDCKISSFAFEPFIMLSVAIPRSNSPVKLSDCLREHCSKYMLVDKNKYQCSNCKDYRDATQVTFVWELPEILIIHLKRFSSELIGNFCRTEKISTKIDFPLDNLDLTDYISPYNKKEARYELYAVDQQFGSLSGGHYIACCKNSINNNWYEFDDSNVTYIEREKVESELVSSNAYILFYKKTYKAVDDEGSE